MSSVCSGFMYIPDSFDDGLWSCEGKFCRTGQP